MKTFPDVKVEVSVSDITPIGDLNETHFEVYESGRKVNYIQVESGKLQKQPKHLVLLIDASRSLDKRAFELQIAAVRAFIEGLNENDRVAIISFEDKVVVHCAFTTSREQMQICINSIRRGGMNTVLYDAVEEAWSLIEKNSEERNSVILFTDGKEEGSSVTLNDLLTKTTKVRLPVFIVGTGQKSELTELARLSHLSGGEIYHTTEKENIGKIYKLLNSLLNGTYIIRYRSNMELSGSGGLTTLEIRFHSNILEDQDIMEYYAPAGFFRKMVFYTGLEERDFLVLLGLFVVLITTFWVGLSLRRVGRKIPKPESARKTDHLDRIVLPMEEEFKVPVQTGMEPKKAMSIKEPLPVDYHHAYILEKEGPETGKKHKIRWHLITIGHGDENTIVLEDSTVSYKHAKIEWKKGVFYLYDLMSEHGVYLNGKKLLRPRAIEDFDQIEIGRTVLLFRRAAG
ncbi:MAG: VWA domain-containing protein [Leptospirales bacterium]